MTSKHKGPATGKPARSTPRKTSLRRLTPKDGPWSLDFSLVDRHGPFPWPGRGDATYAEFAGFLAALNEDSLDDVLAAQRSNGQSANHALEVHDLSHEAQAQWAFVYAEHKLDEDPFEDIKVLTLSYCYGAGDGRRIVVILDGLRRRIYPLWWDPEHRVSGTDKAKRAPTVCAASCIHPKAS